MDTTIYETNPLSEDEEATTRSVSENENIITEYVSQNDAVSSLITSQEPYNIEEKIERIKKEIQDVAASGEFIEAVDLANMLKQVIKNNKTRSIRPIKKVNDLCETGEEKESSTCNCGCNVNHSLQNPRPSFIDTPSFVALESRIANLESVCGISTSAYHEIRPIADVIDGMKKTIEYLQYDISKTADVGLNETASSSNIETKYRDQVDALYSRLANLDDAIRVLPSVTQRLQTLRFVHAEQISSARDNSELDSRLEAIQKNMEQWRLCLDKLEAKCDEFMLAS